MPNQGDLILAAIAPEAEALVVAFKALGEVAEKASNPLKTLGEVAKASSDFLLKPLQGLGEGVNALATAFKAPIAVLDSLTSGIRQLVQASNPAEMLRFNMAMQDLMASLGVIFEPIISAAAQVADIFNRVFTELQGTFQPIMRQLGQVIVEVGGAIANALRPVFAAFAPVLQMVVGLFQQLVPVLTPIINAIANLFTDLLHALQPLIQTAIPYLIAAVRWLAETIQGAVTYIRALTADPGETVGGTLQTAFGLMTANSQMAAAGMARVADVVAQLPNWAQMQSPLAASQTVAARQPQMIGIEQLGEQARLAAFGARAATDQRSEMIRLLQRIADGIVEGATAPPSPPVGQTLNDAAAGALAGAFGI